jgi:PhnB protein
MSASPVPQGYHTVTPYLIVKSAAKAIEFYRQAFGAKELMRFDQPDGKIGHAEIKIGDSPVMLADEFPDMGFRSPETLGGAGVSMMIYVDNVDRVYSQSISAGAKVLKPLQDQFWGDRTGTVTDPFGHIWTIATHKEEVSPEEIKRRFEEMMKHEAAR